MNADEESENEQKGELGSRVKHVQTFRPSCGQCDPKDLQISGEA